MTSPDPDRLRAVFDAEWYMAANPDVAAAGIDPWRHYLDHGRSEGRQPRRSAALSADRGLWVGHAAPALWKLRRLSLGDDPMERGVAGWILARYAAATGTVEAALDHLAAFLAEPEARLMVQHSGPDLLAVDLMLRLGQTEGVAQAIASAEAAGASASEAHYARMLQARAAGEDWSGHLSAIHRSAGLAGLRVAEGAGGPLDRLTATDAAPAGGGVKVSVIVPAHDAELTLPAALDSLLSQDWRDLEIIVVDDASTDGTAGVIGDYASRDERVTAITMETNGGAYLARNAGLAAATGAFVTVQDADDVAHPAKIRLQVQALRAAPRVAATVSAWLRVDDDLAPARWRMEESWVHRNVSSLMVRSSLVRSIGGWDRVRADADTEFYHRLIAARGPSSIVEVCPGVPLSFGRVSDGSLTAEGPTHARTRLAGPRRDYLEAARQWHGRTRRLRMPRQPDERPFRAPAALRPADPSPPPTDFDLVLGSPLFDAAWYLWTNPDVLESGAHPATHYATAGFREGRDPGPRFCGAAYAALRGLPASTNPLIAAHGLGDTAGGAAILPGGLDVGGPVLVVAGGGGPPLLPLIARLVAGGARPVAVLSGMPGDRLMSVLRQMTGAVAVLPEGRPHVAHPPHPETVAAIGALIADWGATAVHVVGAGRRAPVLAATGAEVIVHLSHPPDAAWSAATGFDPSARAAEWLDGVGRILTYTDAAADWAGDLAKPAPAWRDPAAFETPWSPGPALKVGLFGGAEADHLEIAMSVHRAGSGVMFRSRTPAETPPGLWIPPGGDDAVGEVDLVVDLTQKGGPEDRLRRTLAAGRPVITWPGTAAADLIGGNQSGGGVTVHRRTAGAVADMILSLDTARRTLARLSVAARANAADQ